MGKTMPPTVQEFLRCIEPRQVDSKGRYKSVPESRLRTFAATKEVLTAAPTDLRHAVALTLAAAARHGAEAKDVWRHVRRYRAQTHPQAEQLQLPIPPPARAR
jgi:hypothetical protein